MCLFLFISSVQNKDSLLLYLPSFLLSFPPSFFSARLTGAAGGEAAAAAAVVWSLAAKNGIKSVARRDEELDSLPFLLSLWTRSCSPPVPSPLRGVGDAVGRGESSGRVRSLPGRCQRSTSEGPHQATPVPHPSTTPKAGLYAGAAAAAGRREVRVSGPAEVLSSQDVAPGQAWAQLDDAAADGYQWRLPSFITNLCATTAGATVEELAVVEILCSVRGVPGEGIRSVIRFCRRDCGLCESETRRVPPSVDMNRKTAAASRPRPPTVRSE